MKQYLPLLVTALVAVGSAFSAQATSYISAHPTATLVVGLLASALHAVLPSIFATKE